MLGMNSASSRTCRTPVFCSASLPITAIEMGTSVRLSVRFCAVTTTSSSMPALPWAAALTDSTSSAASVRRDCNMG